MIVCLCVGLGGCQTLSSPAADSGLPPVRFLLTFDDGPSADPDDNTTLRILRHLETNRVQPGTKALFFVQTRNADGGASTLGRQLLRRSVQMGHVLGLHSGTERGHIRHTLMHADELSTSLRHGADDLHSVAADQTLLVRPPYWGYNDHTVDLYAAHGYRMLLTDVNTRDGTMFHNFVGMQNRIYKSLRRISKAIARGELPAYRGAIPLVVTFHDLNPFTSYSIGYYMKMLVDAANAAGLRTTDKPFYDTREDIVEVALLRAETPETLALKNKRLRPIQPVEPTTTAALDETATALR